MSKRRADKKIQIGKTQFYLHERVRHFFISQTKVCSHLWSLELPFSKKTNPHQHHHRYCYGHRFLSRTFDLACTGCNWFVLLFLRKQKEQKDFLFLIALYFLCHSLYLIAKNALAIKRLNVIYKVIGGQQQQQQIWLVLVATGSSP